MAFNLRSALTSSPSVGPRQPDAQGSQGHTAQPNASSTLAGRLRPGATGRPPRAEGTLRQTLATPAQAAGTGPTGTPVASNGLIPPAQPYQGTPQAVAPAPQAQPATPAQAPAPPANLPPGATDMGNNLVRLANGAVVDRNHPLFLQAMQQAPGGGAPGAPASQQLAALTTNAPGTAGMQLGDPTKLTHSAAPVYNPYEFTQFSQYQDMTNPTVDAAGSGLVTNMLAQPHTMNAQAVGMLQEQQKEQALAQQQAIQAALTRRQALSGFEMGGGYQQAQERRLGEATQRGLLESNRTIALEKMARDRQDEIQALQTADAWQQGLLGRRVQGYGATLAGEQAQAGDAFRGYGSQSDAFNQHQNVALQAQQQALQRTLGQGGLDLGRAQLGESGRQFDLSHQLNWAGLMNDMLMGRMNHGLSMAQLQQMAQNNAWSFLQNQTR